MSIFNIFAALVLAAMLAGCATTDTASRNAQYDVARTGTAQQVLPSMRVTDINISVPRTLRVSEANRYYPSGDIVWRGDPIGDRHAQVAAIFETAMKRGTAPLNGQVPVVLDIEVERFHALTEKTRYTVGGVHSIRFALAVRHAQTGQIVIDRHIVEADLQGFGGQRAIEAESQGQGQKVRITAHLANVIRTELETPGGHRNERLGIIQALNRL